MFEELELGLKRVTANEIEPGWFDEFTGKSNTSQSDGDRRQRRARLIAEPLV
jgi:hypothetical protein